MPELRKQLSPSANPTRSSAKVLNMRLLHSMAKSGVPKLPSCLFKVVFLSCLKRGTLATSLLTRLITNFKPYIFYSNFSFRHFFKFLFQKFKDDPGFWDIFVLIGSFTQYEHEVFQDSTMLMCSFVLHSSFLLRAWLYPQCQVISFSVGTLKPTVGITCKFIRL